jgi:hypothetical protein
MPGSLEMLNDRVILSSRLKTAVNGKPLGATEQGVGYVFEQRPSLSTVRFACGSP